MSVLPTVRIAHPKKAGGVLINQADFDPKLHRLHGTPEPAAPAAPSPAPPAAAPTPVGAGTGRRNKADDEK